MSGRGYRGRKLDSENMKFSLEKEAVFQKGTCDEMRGRGLERLEIKLDRLSQLEKRIDKANKLLTEFRKTYYSNIGVDGPMSKDLQKLQQILTGVET